MNITKNYVRYLFLALTLVLSVGFSSCSDDDEASIGSESDLIGTWQCTYGEITATVDGETESYSDEFDMKIKFNENGTAILDNKTYSWSYKGNKLTLNYDGDGQETFTVTTLTNTKLVMEMHLKTKEDGVTYELYEKLTFIKISN